MIAFGMKTTLVRFQEEYYNYKGVVGNDIEDRSKDDNRLAIGAFEAAFWTYWDYGLTIFDVQKTVQEAIKWVRDFQLQ
eukprot:15067633-Ditylum_brightwellii.AAC.1